MNNIHTVMTMVIMISHALTDKDCQSEVALAAPSQPRNRTLIPYAVAMNYTACELMVMATGKTPDSPTHDSKLLPLFVVNELIGDSKLCEIVFMATVVVLPEPVAAWLLPRLMFALWRETLIDPNLAHSAFGAKCPTLLEIYVERTALIWFVVATIGATIAILLSLLAIYVPMLMVYIKERKLATVSIPTK